MSQQYKIDLIFFLVWPLVAAGSAFSFPVNAFLSPLLFYGVPAILLSFRRPRFIKKALVFSLFSIPFIVVVDYIAELTGTWLWPIPDTVFSHKVFDYVSFEVIIWVFLHFYIVVLFYEYFFDKHVVDKLWYPKSNKALLLALAIFSVFLVTLLFYPVALVIPHWYLIFGSILILPPILFEEFKFPKVFFKIIKAATYFIYINFVYEVVALKIGWWSFPSEEFIGWVSFLGTNFPFEEFFFWIILFTLAILSYYEYFFDNEM